MEINRCEMETIYRCNANIQGDCKYYVSRKTDTTCVCQLRGFGKLVCINTEAQRGIAECEATDGD